MGKPLVKTPEAPLGGAPLANIAVREGSNGIVAVIPDGGIEVHDITVGADTGLEGVTTAERKIPIIRKLDPKSPQCKPVARGGIPGAKGGSIMNTLTNQIYDGERGLYFIGSHRSCKYVNYIKREDDGTGGGFLGVYEPEDPLVKQRQKETIEKYGDLFRKLENGLVPDTLPSGDKNPNAGKEMQLVETWYIGGVAIVPNEDGSYPGEYGETFPALVPFSSTDIKAYGAWLDRTKNMKYNVRVDGRIQPTVLEMWSHVWHLSTFFFERGSQSWYKWMLRLASQNDDKTEAHYSKSRLPASNPLFKEAEDVRKSIMAGNVEIDFSKQEDQGGGEGGGPNTSGSKEHIPV